MSAFGVTVRDTHTGVRVRVSVSTGAHTSGLYVNDRVFSAGAHAHIRVGSITLHRMSQYCVRISNDGISMHITNAHMFGTESTGTHSGMTRHHT